MESKGEHKSRNLDDFAGIASDWFWETDSEHRFTFFSARMEEVTKIPAAYLLGQRRDAVTGNTTTPEQWQKHLDDLNAHRPFRDFDYSIARPGDGSRLWMRVAGQPLFDEDGTFIGYRGTGHDITREVETIHRLEVTNAALAERNAELQATRNALESAAYEDSLTKLANRRAFQLQLDEILAGPEQTIALLHADLDKFKWVNDTLGHPVGDAVLVAAANRLRSVVRDAGRVFRLGGDEFMIVLTKDVTQDRANWIGDSIIDAMSAPVFFDSKRATVGASVGVVIAKTTEFDASQLVADADVALYEAKNSGRNTVRHITPEVRARMQSHWQMAVDIPRGLEADEFIPHFQPQIDMGTGAVVGAEALVRWDHPTKGLLPPSAFLDAASELGLLSEIDHLMLRKALATARRLRQQGLILPAVSINISAARLTDPSLPTDIAQIWEDPSCALGIELLETIYFDENQASPHFAKNLAELREMGVRIETDDFGSGRASITGLLRISPDRLKIDRSLIQDAVINPTTRSVVAAIFEMTRAMGIEALAEGVESQDDITSIRALGCDVFQGYAVSYPLDEPALATFLAERQHLMPETETAGPMDLPKRA